MLETLVARAWMTGRASAAALVRRVHKDQPTLLLDEADASFNGEKDYAEALRGILNTGYRRSGKSTLCVGQGAQIQVKDFSTFCPKAIAGIGKLPGTIADRSIPIELRRRTSDERCERWRERDGHAAGATLHDQLASWAKGATERLRTAEPDFPRGLGDRQADAWEPLLAIADLAGGDWAKSARLAAVGLCGENEDSDVNVELLHDIRTLFDADAVDFIGSTDLARKLAEMTERPWAAWRHGKPISPHAIADRLKQFGIVPRPNESGSARGYYRDRFEDAWRRYPSFQVSERQHNAEETVKRQAVIRQTKQPADSSQHNDTPPAMASSDDLTFSTDTQKEDRDVDDS